MHHSDKDSQYLSIRYPERLAEAGIESSVGSTGDSYDNAMAESIIGLFKTRKHLAERTVEKLRSSRIRDTGMGRLVKQQTTTRADRRCPAG